MSFGEDRQQWQGGTRPSELNLNGTGSLIVAVCESGPRLRLGMP